MTTAEIAGTVPPGSVVVTPYQMYREMQDIGKEVRHLSAVIDPAITDLREHVTANATAIEKLDVRLRTVEMRIWFASGFAACLGAVGGWIISVLSGG